MLMSRTRLADGRSRQPYARPDGSPSTIPTTDPFTVIQFKRGQIGPSVEEHWRMEHGRHLAGLSGLNETQQPWDDRSGFMRELEQEDDVYGSGIFDAYGRQGTINVEMGVFTDHPSLPGFIDREVQFEASRDIYDITTGAQVVVVPGGGMSYQERGGLPYPVQGQSPCGPPRALPPPTRPDQVYVALNPGQPLPPRPRYQPVFRPLPGPDTRPVPIPAQPSRPAPSQRPFTRVPQFPAERPVPIREASTSLLATRSVMPSRQIVNQGVMSVGPAGYQPTQVPSSAQFTSVPQRQIVTTGSPSTNVVALRGLGADEDKPGWGTYAFAGLLVGGAAAMLYGATRMGKAR